MSLHLNDHDRIIAQTLAAAFCKKFGKRKARQARAKAYPRKDSSGRLLIESFCTHFILTSMGGSVMNDTISFLFAKNRNSGATLHPSDVLVTQHAEWTAKRVRRGLFGQSIVDFFTDSWCSIQVQESAKSN